MPFAHESSVSVLKGHNNIVSNTSYHPSFCTIPAARSESAMSDESVGSGSTISNTTTNSVTSFSDTEKLILPIGTGQYAINRESMTGSVPSSTTHSANPGSSGGGIIDSFPRKSRVQNPWANVEDVTLTETVKNSPHPLMWNQIALCLPGRSAKQCRERWSEHLDPIYDRSPFSTQEDALVLQAQRQLGNKWKDISSFFQEKLRTPSSVKVRWHFLDRQIKKYGAAADGLPNYPHISYSHWKGAPAATPPAAAPACTVPASDSSCGQATQAAVSAGSSSADQQYQVNQHQMMSFEHYSHLQAQAQAQAQTGTQAQAQLPLAQGIPAFMAASHAAPMYMMPPRQEDNDRFMPQLTYQQQQQQMPVYFFNPASLLCSSVYASVPTGGGSGPGCEPTSAAGSSSMPQIPPAAASATASHLSPSPTQPASHPLQPVALLPRQPPTAYASPLTEPVSGNVQSVVAAAVATGVNSGARDIQTQKTSASHGTSSQKRGYHAAEHHDQDQDHEEARESCGAKEKRRRVCDVLDVDVVTRV